MILEFIAYARTRGTKLARDWGYVYQNVSLKFRARRCARSWQSHIEQCHQVVREGLEKIRPQSVMIIGSGLLIELPVEDLLRQVDRLILVDIVHAPEIRKLAKSNQKIELIEKDISGLLGLLPKGQGPYQASMIPWSAVAPWGLPKVNWVISANLLSQIPLMISEQLPMSTEVYNRFARKVRDQHIERLCDQAEHVLLFADFETRYITPGGEQIKKESYEVQLRGLRFMREWPWEISPLGETSKDYRVEMLVKAYANY